MQKRNSIYVPLLIAWTAAHSKLEDTLLALIGLALLALTAFETARDCYSSHEAHIC